MPRTADFIVQSEQLQEKAEGVLKEIQEEVQRFLNSLVDIKLAVEPDGLACGKRLIDSIKVLVRKSGQELFYNERPINLRVIVGSRASHVSFQATTIRTKPQKWLYSGTTFPQLKVLSPKI